MVADGLPDRQARRIQGAAFDGGGESLPADRRHTVATVARSPDRLADGLPMVAARSMFATVERLPLPMVANPAARACFSA